jgi:CHC2 zinc finger/Toprim-like
MADTLALAEEYHRNLPQPIRDYLREQRGISDPVIDLRLLGWNGSRITIPIFDQSGSFAFFKLAKDPEDNTDGLKMLTSPGGHAELYGWERVLANPEQIVICEGEFDRLVLESRGFGAVTSTGGALTFRPEWAEAFREIPNVYICFDNDDAGRAGAERVARLIPNAKILRLPEEVGEGGDVTDFFVRLGRSREEFIHLLDAAQSLPEKESTAQPSSQYSRIVSIMDEEVDRLKSLVAIEEFVARYVPLRRTGQKYFIGRCPFHLDRNPSLVVYPQTQSFHCFGCREHGDVITFVMRKERLTFPEALRALREIHG